MLSANLTDQQRKSLQVILTTAEQKKNQKRSDEIEKSGGKFKAQLKTVEKRSKTNWKILFIGFQFTQQTVPTTFNFSSPPSN